jgi:hypothetical protein
MFSILALSQLPANGQSKGEILSFEQQMNENGPE